MFGIGAQEILLLVIMISMFAIPYRICRKAGYSGWLGLLAFVPLANIVLIYLLALAEWPIEKELAALRQAKTSGEAA